MAARNELYAGEIARGVADGAFTAEAVVEACLARIEARETEVRAWAFLDPDLARAQARERDAAARPGPLQGVPIGIKDIIATADMPTGMGSPIYRGRRRTPPASPWSAPRARSSSARP